MGRSDDAPDDVGESQSRSAEDIKDNDGKEAGRKDTAPKRATDRPSGTFTARDS